jgi:hypothetical protein
VSAKRPDLSAVIAASGSTRRQEHLVPSATSMPVPPERSTARTRIGTKQIAAHFPADVAWQLRALAVERRSTVQDLLAEALNDLFAKHGKPEIAPLERKV